MFVLRLDGEIIATTDELVTGIRVQTARGEVSAVGLAPNEGVVDIILDRVAPGGPLRLDQIEAQALQDIRDRQIVGQPVGINPINQTPPTSVPQTNPSTTAAQMIGLHPSMDLSSGLTPGDTDTINQRISDFGDHGDAAKAVADNPPGSGQPAPAPVVSEPQPVDSAGVPIPVPDPLPSTTDSGTPPTSSTPPVGILPGSPVDVVTAGMVIPGDEDQDVPPNNGAPVAVDVNPGNPDGISVDPDPASTVSTTLVSTPSDSDTLAAMVAPVSVDESVSDFEKSAPGTVGVLQADGTIQVQK